MLPNCAVQNKRRTNKRRETKKKKRRKLKCLLASLSNYSAIKTAAPLLLLRVELSHLRTHSLSLPLCVSSLTAVNAAQAHVVILIGVFFYLILIFHLHYYHIHTHIHLYADRHMSTDTHTHMQMCAHNLLLCFAFRLFPFASHSF